MACVVASVSVAQQQSAGRIDNIRLSFDLDNSLKEEEPPVPILRFIDTQNPDGSYTYGYESGDGTYKIETRYATGEVKGKYGYIDPNGELREVEYGASPNRGFEPRAEGLIVAPPTLVDETAIEEDEPVEFGPALPAAKAEPAQPAQRANNFANFSPNNDARRVVIRRRPTQQARRTSSSSSAGSILAPTPAPVFRPQPRQQAAPVFRPQQQPAAPFVPVQVDPHRFFGHPAQNIDLNTGSYSVSYTG